MPSHADQGGTHFYQALKRAVESFEAVPPQGDEDEVRHRAIILLSDGLPTAPPPVKNAEAFTLVGARAEEPAD